MDSRTKSNNEPGIQLSLAKRQVLLAIAVGVIVGCVLGGLSSLYILNSQSDIVEQKFLSLRYRLAEYLPQPSHPDYIPTPLAMPTDEPTPTSLRRRHLRRMRHLRQICLSHARHPLAFRRAHHRPPSPLTFNRFNPRLLLRGIKQDYQRWNNCGPTTLGMMLSYFGKTDTQAEIAAFTKPNYDDRNVRPDELAAYVSRTGLHSIIRVNGDVDLLKLFLSNKLPVMTETAFEKPKQGWMGHYRLLTGYDATQFSTNDSYDGATKISFDDLDAEWRAFNRVYIVIYSDAQSALVRAIIGDAWNDATMYTHAVAQARTEIAADPKDAFAQFNLGSSLLGLKQSKESAAAFDRARTLGLPWRMMWYQFGPYKAYLNTGRNNEVIALADSLLKSTDDLEESHYYKGLALRALKREEQARAEFETALKYNKNYHDAQEALRLESGRGLCHCAVQHG